jgi:hypothetical protein
MQSRLRGKRVQYITCGTLGQPWSAGPGRALAFSGPFTTGDGRRPRCGRAFGEQGVAEPAQPRKSLYSNARFYGLSWRARAALPRSPKVGNQGCFDRGVLGTVERPSPIKLSGRLENAAAMQGGKMGGCHSAKSVLKCARAQAFLPQAACSSCALAWLALGPRIWADRMFLPSTPMDR